MKSLEQIATGFRAPGHNAAQFVVVIGEAGAGKTRYALSIAGSLALMSRPLPVLLYAPGVSRRALLSRLIETWKPVQLPLLRARTKRLRSAPLFIETRPRLWPLDLWIAARKVKNLRCLIVDDLHCAGGRSYAQKVSDFKILARELRCLIVVLAKPHPSLSRALRTEQVAFTTLHEEAHEPQH